MFFTMRKEKRDGMDGWDGHDGLLGSNCRALMDV
jgi:hypothetical protein